MSYRNDAFYNLKDNNGMSGPYMGANHASNARFVYPSDRIRFLGAAEQLVDKDADISGYKIQRGYIRGLQQPGVNGGSFQPLKCSFQFNPQQITQVVTMREDVYLPIMQDPVQFTQPFAAMTNFNFDLLFDRSREVEGAVSFTDDGGVSQDPFVAADRDNIDYKRDVRDIGAMADLQVLYSIIGQGFSKETLAFQASRLKQAGIAQLNKDGGTDPSDPNATNAGNIDSRVSAYINESNIGNSAFLIPNPVRVIFSSMFMVDGFITGTTVDFLKFSTKMVPLQIRVGLTMNAMYIGFAREKTFLTEQLDQQAAQLKEQAAQDAAATVELQKAADDILDSFGYTLRWRHIGNPNNKPYKDYEFEGLLNGEPTTTGDYIPIYQWAFENGERKNAIEVWARAISFGFIPKKNNSSTPKVSDFIKDHQISYKWWFTVWGPTDQTNANKIRAAKGSGYNNKIVGNYAGAQSSTSGWTEWNQYLEDGTTSLKNGSGNRLKHTYPSNTVYTSASAAGVYYATKLSVEVTVTSTTTNGTSITKTGTADVWKVLAAADYSYSQFKLNWGSTGSRPIVGGNNFS